MFCGFWYVWDSSWLCLVITIIEIRAGLSPVGVDGRNHRAMGFTHSSHSDFNGVKFVRGNYDASDTNCVTQYLVQVTTKKERKNIQSRRSSDKKNWVWWWWWRRDDERIDEYEIAAGGRSGTERWEWYWLGLGGLIRHNNGDNIMTLSRSWLPWKRSWALARSHCSLDGVDALFFLPYLCPFILSSHLPLSRCCLHRHRGRVHTSNFFALTSAKNGAYILIASRLLGRSRLPPVRIF